MEFPWGNCPLQWIWFETSTTLIHTWTADAHLIKSTTLYHMSLESLLSPSTLSVHPSHTWPPWMFREDATGSWYTLRHAPWTYCTGTPAKNWKTGSKGKEKEWGKPKIKSTNIDAVLKLLIRELKKRRRRRQRQRQRKRHFKIQLLVSVTLSQLFQFV